MLGQFWDRSHRPVRALTESGVSFFAQTVPAVSTGEGAARRAAALSKPAFSRYDSGVEASKLILRAYVYPLRVRLCAGLSTPSKIGKSFRNKHSQTTLRCDSGCCFQYFGTALPKARAQISLGTP